MGFSSIISVLDSINEKVNIFIIHKNNSDDIFIPNAINDHVNLNKLNIYKFNNKTNHFPNIEKAIFLKLLLSFISEDYIDDDIDFLLYLDADVICIKDPLNYIKKKISMMKEKYCNCCKSMKT